MLDRDCGLYSELAKCMHIQRWALQVLKLIFCVPHSDYENDLLLILVWKGIPWVSINPLKSNNICLDYKLHLHKLF